MYLDEPLHPWLVIMLGKRAAEPYAGMPNTMLLDLFPTLQYGPHGQELVTLCDAINDVFARPGSVNFLRDLADTFYYFQAAAYTNHCLYFGVTLEPQVPYIDPLGEGYLERADTRRPMVRLRLWDLIPNAPRSLPDAHVRALNCMMNAVLLQHWYAPRVHIHAELRKFVPQHNAFCQHWGLPLLSHLPDMVGDRYGASV